MDETPFYTKGEEKEKFDFLSQALRVENRNFNLSLIHQEEKGDFF